MWPPSVGNSRRMPLRELQKNRRRNPYSVVGVVLVAAFTGTFTAGHQSRGDGVGNYLKISYQQSLTWSVWIVLFRPSGIPPGTKFAPGRARYAALPLPGLFFCEYLRRMAGIGLARGCPSDSRLPTRHFREATRRVALQRVLRPERRRYRVGPVLGRDRAGLRRRAGPVLCSLVRCR